MRKVAALVLSTVLFLSAQSILWEKTIPFETDDDGPVGIDVASNGDIMVACYTNGPNYSQWVSGTNTLIHAPDTKVIRIDKNGNLLSSQNFGVLFNNGIIGIGNTETGFTLFGNYSYGDINYIPNSAWLMKFQNDQCDTIKYDCFGFDSGYSFEKCKTSFMHEPLAILNDYFIGLKSSSNSNYLINSKNEWKFNYNCISFPDSIFIDPDYQWAQFFSITDFDLNDNGDIFLLGSISGMYVDYRCYSFLIKIDSEDNVIWQKYNLKYDHPESQFRNYTSCVSATIDGGCIYGVWKDENGNHIVDENENYLIKLDSDGNTIYSKYTVTKIMNLHRVGKDEFIYKAEGSDEVTKIIDTGTELQEVWAHSFPNTGVIRPIENGFISAGIKDNNIYIFKVATGTGIEDSSIPSSTELHQNYPNPFNPETTIKYSLASAAKVKLTVFDIAGREVAELTDMKQAGNHEYKFNGGNLTSGLYFYRLSVDGKTVQSRKMMLLK
jgi:hypothetical protein